MWEFARILPWFYACEEELHILYIPYSMLDATSERDTRGCLRALQRLFQDGGSPGHFPPHHFLITTLSKEYSILMH